MLSYWNRGLTQVCPQLEGQTQTQVAVVGGSFAGLSCAYRLSQRGYDVVVLEKELVGEAAGRSAGLLVASTERDLCDFVADYGEEKARAIWSFATESVKETEAIVTNLGIAEQSSFVRSGSIYVGKIEERAYLRTELLLRQRLGFEGDLREMPRNPLSAGGYTSAIETSDDCTIDPTGMCRALARWLAESRGVRIFERSSVQSIDSRARQCITQKGRVRYDSIVLAGQDVPERLGYKARQFPIATCCIVTAPLSPSLITELGMERRISFWDTRMPFHYGRVTPDDRLLFGGGDLLLQLAGGWLSRRKILALQEVLRKRIPALGRTQVELCWEGANCIAPDGLPRIGRLGPSLYAVSCSAGIGQAVLAGRMAADLVLEPNRQVPDFVAFGRRTGRFPRLSSPLQSLRFAFELLGLTS
jgi:gamma-glutamylputrescine oxidase